MNTNVKMSLSVLFILANSHASFAEGLPVIALDNRKNIHPTKNYAGKLPKTIIEINDSRLPYFEIGGTRFFNAKNSATAISYDFFIPLWQTTNNLIFTDARIYDRSGKPFEGNLHFGYRQLSADNQQIFGIYGAFDRKKTGFSNYFSQITLGGEYHFNKLFIGGNFYQPLGKNTKQTGKEITYTKEETENNPNGIYKNTWLMANKSYEKALPGADLELGYELARGLTGYLGGYYFKAREVEAIYGPKICLSYDLYSHHSKKILGVFDKISFGAGIQNDKPNGTVGYVSANFRIGLLPNKHKQSKLELEGVSRHMLDLIHRDVDIVTSLYSKHERISKVASRFYPYTATPKNHLYDSEVRKDFDNKTSNEHDNFINHYPIAELIATTNTSADLETTPVNQSTTSASKLADAVFFNESLEIKTLPLKQNTSLTVYQPLHLANYQDNNLTVDSSVKRMFANEKNSLLGNFIATTLERQVTNKTGSNYPLAVYRPIAELIATTNTSADLETTPVNQSTTSASKLADAVFFNESLEIKTLPLKQNTSLTVYQPLHLANYQDNNLTVDSSVKRMFANEKNSLLGNFIATTLERQVTNKTGSNYPLAVYRPIAELLSANKESSNTETAQNTAVTIYKNQLKPTPNPDNNTSDIEINFSSPNDGSGSTDLNYQLTNTKCNKPNSSSLANYQPCRLTKKQNWTSMTSTNDVPNSVIANNNTNSTKEAQTGSTDSGITNWIGHHPYYATMASIGTITGTAIIIGRANIIPTLAAMGMITGAEIKKATRNAKNYLGGAISSLFGNIHGGNGNDGAVAGNAHDFGNGRCENGLGVAAVVEAHDLPRPTIQVKDPALADANTAAAEILPVTVPQTAIKEPRVAAPLVTNQVEPPQDHPLTVQNNPAETDLTNAVPDEEPKAAGENKKTSEGKNPAPIAAERAETTGQPEPDVDTDPKAIIERDDQQDTPTFAAAAASPEVAPTAVAELPEEVQPTPAARRDPSSAKKTNPASKAQKTPRSIPRPGYMATSPRHTPDAAAIEKIRRARANEKAATAKRLQDEEQQRREIQKPEKIRQLEIQRKLEEQRQDEDDKRAHVSQMRDDQKGASIQTQQDQAQKLAELRATEEAAQQELEEKTVAQKLEDEKRIEEVQSRTSQERTKRLKLRPSPKPTPMGGRREVTPDSRPGTPMGGEKPAASSSQASTPIKPASSGSPLAEISPINPEKRQAELTAQLAATQLENVADENLELVLRYVERTEHEAAAEVVANAALEFGDEFYPNLLEMLEPATAGAPAAIVTKKMLQSIILEMQRHHPH